MLQRGLVQIWQSAFNTAPLLASGASSICSQLACCSASTSSSTSSSTCSAQAADSSRHSSSQQLPHSNNSSCSSLSTSSSAQAVFMRGFKTGVVDVQKQKRYRKGFLPYFNPDDGPEGSLGRDAVRGPRGRGCRGKQCSRGVGGYLPYFNPADGPECRCRLLGRWEGGAAAGVCSTMSC